MDLVAAGAAVVDRALFKKGILHRERLATEGRGNDAAFPVEVDQRAVDAGNALVSLFIAAENALVIHRDKSLEARPVHTDLLRQLFQDLNALRAADREEDDIAQLGPLLAVIVDHIAQAVHKRLAGGDDVADQQRAVRHGGKLAVFDLKARHLAVFKNALARHKADVVDADVLFVAALLQRVVQGSPQDREDIRRRDLLFLLQVVHHLRGRRHERGVHLVAHHLRMVHQLSRLGLRDNVILVEEVPSLQTVAVHALIAELRHDLNVLPIFDHRSLLLKKDHLSRNRQMVHILNMKSKKENEMTFVAFFQQHSRRPPFFQLMTLYG